MNQSSDLIQQLLAHAAQGEAVSAADATAEVPVLASAIHTREQQAFLHGGRDIPLSAVLSRLLLGLGRDADALASQVKIVLGVRETEPQKVMWSELSSGAITAIASTEAVVDGDQFFLEEGGHLVAHRLLPIHCRRPADFAHAWRIAESTWGRFGAARIQWALQTDADGPVPMMDYSLEPVGVWRDPEFSGGLAGPCQLGAEHVLLQLVLIAAGSTHPMRKSLVESGLLREGEVAIALIAMPNLAPLARLSAGPAANNVLGSEADGPFSGSQSPYSAWSSLAAKQLVDEWGLENGSTSGLENLDGVSDMVEAALGGIVEGELVGEGSAERSYGVSLAEWIASAYTPDAPDVGAGLVREVIRRRHEGEPLSLAVKAANGITGLSVVEVGESGSVTREQRLF